MVVIGVALAESSLGEQQAPAGSKSTTSQSIQPAQVGRWGEPHSLHFRLTRQWQQFRNSACCAYLPYQSVPHLTSNWPAKHKYRCQAAYFRPASTQRCVARVRLVLSLPSISGRTWSFSKPCIPASHSSATTKTQKPIFIDHGDSSPYCLSAAADAFQANFIAFRPAVALSLSVCILT